MARVFVSYARDDRSLAARVVAQLEIDGHEVWWDQRLSPTRGFDRLIEDELRGADAVVVLWTKASVASEWVRNEASYAVEKLVPARFETVDLPIAFHRLQTADLAGWSGGSDHPEWQRLLSWIEEKSKDPVVARRSVSQHEHDAARPTHPVLLALFALGAAITIATIVMTIDDTPSDECAAVFPDARGLPVDYEANIPLAPDCIERDFATFKDCDVCPQIVVLPPGEFEMGTGSWEGGEPDERPVRTVTLKYRIGIGRFEVTWEEWQACVASGACTIPGHARDDRTGRLPVHALSWDATHDYLAWLSDKTGEVYRLPTEAEWEYAAKAGKVGQYPHGGDVGTICRSANVLDRSARESMATLAKDRASVPCRDGFAYRAPVGSLASNAFGLFDIIGNVVEPVQDCYYASYERATNFGAAYQREDCPGRVIRGAAFDTAAPRLRIGYRDSTIPAIVEQRLGLRVARELR